MQENSHWSRTLAVSRRALADGLMAQVALGAVSSSAWFGMVDMRMEDHTL